MGASAGGLETLKDFFAGMPSDSGLAFVIIQHLDPAHISRTAEILAQQTEMPVAEVKDGMSVSANHVYTNPPDRYVSIHDGRFKLSEQFTQEGIRKPIDFFLISLAEDQQDRAVSIILSGSSGSDCGRGVRAVRAGGGLCIVQDPMTARFPEMPQSIIDVGLADFVIPAGEMPEALLSYVRNQQVQASPTGEESEKASSELTAILDLLRARTKSDYRLYKRATLRRRIGRRMGLRQSPNMIAYLDLLQKDPQELAQLSQDMLIGVSAFFRDLDAFEELKHTVIIPMVESSADAPLRVWVPGCATGEEAYTIAIMLLDALDEKGISRLVQVFATDIDDKALATARAGIYPPTIVEDIRDPRLHRFFSKRENEWQVEKRLRDAVIFSHHNLLTDPPFSKLDLISCRNLLIYLERTAQKKVLTIFSFALNQGGYLFLGKSEGLGEDGDESFETVSKQKRIFRLSHATRRPAGKFSVPSGEMPGQLPRRPETPPYVEAMHEALLKHLNAAIVLIDRKGGIRYLHGKTEKYLSLPKRQPSMNLLDLVEGKLAISLRRAIEKAFDKNESVSLPLVPVLNKGFANVTVTSFETRGNEKMATVIFEEAATKKIQEAPPAHLEDEPLAKLLEDEVKSLRNQIRRDADEYTEASEELKAANEEVTAMNEELQSMNEELEASKEELQSLNEELNTVNNELQDNVHELTTTNSDLANLISATQIATIFLDRKLKIKRFTPKATELLNLISSDIGRPIEHITQNFAGGELAVNARKVLANLSPVETDVQAQNQSWYTIRIVPYRSLDDRIDGVVITFFDITRLKNIENRLQYESDYSKTIVETVRHPLLVLDGHLTILSANKAFYETFKVDPAATAGNYIYDLGNKQWDIPELRELLEKVIPAHASFTDFEVTHNFPEIGLRSMILSGRRIDGVERILLAIEDVTQQRHDSDELRSLNMDMEKRVAERTALAQARLEQLRNLTRELTMTEQRERKRLARMLHDDLQQILVSAQYQLRRIRSHTKDEVLIKFIDEVENTIRESIETSRSLTIELSPTILYEAGLDAALPWLARQMQEKHGIDVQTEIRARVPSDAEGIAILLFEAVRELLFNVVKHSGVKQAVVILDRDDNHVMITVSDKGKGFDISKLGHGSSEQGMGLFGIRERIEHLGGEVIIESTPGTGTSISLKVVLLSPDKVQAQQEWPSVARQFRPKAETGKQKIRVVLVDDHTIVRHGIAEILKEYDDIDVVAEAATGEQAIEAAHREHPDIIVMDVSMPGMNGIEATRIIHDALPDVHIIGLSMYNEQDRASAMKDAGAEAYISKGGPPEDLLAAIHKLALVKQ